MPQHITIPRGTIELAADLHLPDVIDEAAPPRAVVLSTPGSSVKEQIGANYASRLAARGIAALVFDPAAHQGQSGDEPRDLEDPYRRGEDISYAMDALTTIPGIDPARIGVLGICAGGGYAVHTARTDHRIKAVGTVVPGNIGTSFRSFQPYGPATALDAMADARVEETRTGELTRANWLPDTLEDAAAAGLADIDLIPALADRFHLVAPDYPGFGHSAKTTRSSGLTAPAPTSATCPTPNCTCSTPATSRSRRSWASSPSTSATSSGAIRDQ
jgi:uncharacterized protein